MIRISDVRLGILNIDSLEIPKGRTCIIGENGSGKSTFLRLLSGISLPNSGQISVDGNEIRKLNVGFVPEYPERNIIFEDVFDEIISPLRFCYTDPDIAEKKVMNIAEMLNISCLLHKKVVNLSGGEKVFVSLAVAIAAEPLILVLDEPDSHMDPDSSRVLDRFLRNSRVDYIMHCTQNMDYAEKADNLIFMEKGMVKYSGLPGEVFEKLENTLFLPCLWRIKEFAGDSS
ncbi:energy-coupling factor transport system ATP-binding protein [Methanomicrobium sp. W14]|uniref:energy-coupling factor ABC transporter ATP-binding protein n=1 Tax=Methanomicrobium sp. W14 TaxID=2817839 RepID=UPI001AE41C72|nr:energy-coupling factor ABC transporter ATP-binding protein [Methanomicrobium sp. W14]MBP2132792.1 energy-coupling factor transport system ATP-binding protein [Methanomicrobium sp. W14]